MDFSDIRIDDFDYALPPEKIAQFPLAERDKSRLLIVEKATISESQFCKLPDLLPANSLIVWNKSRVIYARLVFFKESGARIEIFCLEPVYPEREISLALSADSGCHWKCMIGNARKWKAGLLSMEFYFEGKSQTLTAEKLHEEKGEWTVRFSWDNAAISLAQVLENVGKVPLPPYIGRDSTENDKATYQTIYAARDGSVAAPTAGLHFTKDVIEKITEKGIRNAEVTLHVGAGTFIPVTASSVAKHTMHKEQICVKKSELDKLILASGNITAVGTTTLRTLESLYWLGVKVLYKKPEENESLKLAQWEVYDSALPADVSRLDAITALSNYMEQNQLNELLAETQLMIVPGYKIRMAEILITNFHQPRSTLLLLVAAFAGPFWREAYKFALKNDFRFLSYGDVCLFFRA